MFTDPDTGLIGFQYYDCSDVSIQDLKVQLGEHIYEIPSADFTFASGYDCMIALTKGVTNDQIILGMPFFVAYDVTFNNADLTVSMSIDTT